MPIAKSARKPNAALMKPVQPDDTLAKIVGSKPIPRSEVTKKIWDYIKKNRLQDAKKKTLINADDALKAVFGGKKQVTMFEMTKHVSGHGNRSRNSCGAAIARARILNQCRRHFGDAGLEQRLDGSALVMFVVDATKPFSSPATFPPSFAQTASAEVGSLPGPLTSEKPVSKNAASQTSRERERD